ncbi:MAG: Asp-tRNA(Asn)/Glu-tRNA(Gln) amidotransferase subunit GatA [Ferruginibacter sp.]
MFSFSHIQQYHDDLKTGKTDCVSAVKFYLSNINNQKKLNAFVEIYEVEALQKATELDIKRKEGHPLKKLHGVIIALKDVICYEGHKVTASSGILKDFVSLYSASCVQYLLEEDAVVIGTCNCDEFAMGSTNENSVYGKVLNAIDETKVPGGSSGGSAVAVQADMCMLSLGSDTGGSVRQPADFCGIIGLKPGYGRISRYGLIAYASSFDQVGIFGKSLHDVALLLDIMGKPDEFDSTMDRNLPVQSLVTFNDHPDKKYKIAYFKQVMEHPSLDKEIAAAIAEQIDNLKEDGHSIEEIEFDLLDYIVPTYYVLTTAEASSNLSRYDGVRYGYRTKSPVKDLTDFYLHNRSEGFGKEVKKRIMLGTFVLSTGFYDAYYMKAQQVRKLLIEKVQLIFSKADAVIMPTSPVTAFNIGQKDQDPLAMYLADIFTVFANLTGLPAISLPLFKHSNGMPFGLQIMTNKAAELTLLEISQLLMQQNEIVNYSHTK